MGYDVQIAAFQREMTLSINYYYNIFFNVFKWKFI